ncbi:MAG: peptidylprolyl isomerase [Pseudomonadota bacterium]
MMNNDVRIKVCFLSKTLILMIFHMLFLMGCVTGQVSVKPLDVSGNPVVYLNSNIGDLRIVLYPEAAPEVVKDLIKFIESGYFNHDTYIEARPGVGLVIAKLGNEKQNFIFKDETNSFKSQRGSIGVAKSSVSNSYINNLFVGYGSLPDIEKHYIIIGQVIKGLDLLEKSANGARYKVNSIEVIKNI